MKDILIAASLGLLSAAAVRRAGLPFTSTLAFTKPHMRTFASIFLFLPLASIAGETPLAVPSDARAKYSILEIGGTLPNRTILTKRVGPSGTSYAKRLYDCSNRTVKYFGDGDSLAELARSKPSPNMGPIVPESIADYVGREACKR